MLGCVLLCSAVTAAAARASSCGWNARCPYTSRTVLGGADPGAIAGPLAATWTPAGDELVLDSGAQSLRLFDPEGQLMARIGSAGEFNNLHAVAVDPQSGEIDAEDASCVRQFNPDGSSGGATFCGARPSLTWTMPVFLGLAAGPSRQIYVYEQASVASGSAPDLRIDVYSQAGLLQTSWAVPPGMTGALAVDASGDAYLGVPDGVDVFSPAGQLLGSFTLPADPTALALAGSTLYAVSGAAGSATVRAYDTTSKAELSSFAVPQLVPSSTTQFPLAPILTVAGSEILAVSGGTELERFDSSGNLQSSWGGSTAPAFAPVGAAEDTAGDVFAVDATAGRVRLVEFGATGGVPVTVANLSTSLPPQAGALPVRVAPDPAGGLLVASAGTLVNVSTSGQVGPPVQLSCGAGCGQVAADAQGDIYVADDGHLDRLSPSGTLLGTIPVAAGAFTVDGTGDLITAQGGMIDRYTPDGTLVASWPAGGQFEPARATSLATDASGRVYASAQDGVHIYGASGQQLAVWPFSSFGARTGTAAFNPGTIDVAPNGDVLISGEADAPGAPDSYVLRYGGLLSPLPAVPPVQDSPWAQQIVLTVGAIRQRGSTLLTALQCAAPVPAVPAPVTLPRGVGCRGTVVVAFATVSTVHGHRRSVTTTLARTSFDLALGHRQTVDVRLSARGWRALQAAGRLRATLALADRPGTTTQHLQRSLVLRGSG